MMNRTAILRKTTLSRPLLAALVAAGLFGAAPAHAKQTTHHQNLNTAAVKHVLVHKQDKKPDVQTASAHAAARVAAKADHHGKGKHVNVASAKHAPTPRFNCVQYVQHATNVGLHGNAWEWWDNADGLFPRGEAPKPGAIMVFSKTGNLPYGHVAVVRQVQNQRSILIDHANWSPIRGRRGQVEKAVRVIDVSDANDWSEVRVWYGPTQDIGSTVYPLNGFIYAHKDVQHHVR
ncbi:MAG TPA: CHAP domain-containing protein [Candidatus Sulfotelmatobacter sp.]|jgi:surface antigen|nr:CHAP domain-containing protein [Candidatus Sulfotelmatobacter sp.]